MLWNQFRTQRICKLYGLLIIHTITHISHDLREVQSCITNRIKHDNRHGNHPQRLFFTSESRKCLDIRRFERKIITVTLYQNNGDYMANADIIDTMNTLADKSLARVSFR